MNNWYKNDINHYIDITPIVDMKGFVTLLLAELASKDEGSVRKGEVRYACLPIDYKSRIEQIMYQQNGWGIKFSRLIDINEYYEDQKQWEQNLGNTIKEVLSEIKNGYKIDCNFETDTLVIPFTVKEIETIKDSYDEETLEIMDYFSNLIVSYCYSREFIIDQRYLNQDINRHKEQHHKFLINELRRYGVKNPEKYLHF